MFSSMLDYSEQILEVVIRDLRDDEMLSEYNGIIYNPKKIFAKVDDYAGIIYKELLNQDGVGRFAQVITEETPEKLAEKFEKQLGIENIVCVNGIITSLRATNEQSKTLFRELKRNPRRFYKPVEKRSY